ncbi:MAG TPA: hypothetical protein VND93_33965 [Myxococcales bacterium]|nr:hypothetical protein [Myxococcales bacterium]
MSDPIGTYTFLPFLRQGVVNRVSGPAVTLRAAVDVSVELEGTRKGGGGTATATIHKAVELYGPGDVIGVDGAQISRMEPANWVTNFEPNYFAAIEFYDEDFPWRYTPAPPSGRRLLPWLALVVLEEGTEFKEGTGIASRPLPYVEVTAGFADVFPEAVEGWAWAHVHFNAELSAPVVEPDGNVASQAAQDAIRAAPDRACSRLLCPRKLKPKTAYHAFLVPAFESGRVAGLGYDPKPLFDDAANHLTATSSAWADYGANRPDPTYFPVYHRWYFRTAERGDFESLVRLLKPKVVNSRVGHRDVDVTDPAPNVTGIDRPELGGILRLGGALRAPLETLSEAEQADYDKYDQWATPYPQPFQRQLAAFVDLADSYQQSGPAANAGGDLDPSVQEDPDPLVVPPIYGRWHALTERLLQERDGSDVPHRENWVHDLNLDPRWRTAAGFGTKVVQQTQESLMEAAWDQIGDVLEANRRIRQAQLARIAGRSLFQAHVGGAASISPGALMLLASPMRARLVSDGRTVRQRMLQSPMGLALTSSAMRRVIRPGGRVASLLGLTATGEKSAGALVARANAGEVSAAPPRVPPEKILTPDDLAQAAAPSGPLAGTWGRLGRWLRDNAGLSLLLLLALVVLVLVVFGLGALGLAVVVAVVAVAAGAYARSVAARQEAADLMKEDQLSPATVDRMPGSSGFALASQVDPRSAAAPAVVQAGQADSAEAVRFKAALKDEYRLLATSKPLGALPVTVPLDLAKVAEHVVAGVRPDLTVPRWTWAGVAVPPRIRDQVGEVFAEVMAYPEFDLPMYEPLVKAGTELFVPNLHLVEPDSVTLLETNQRFIEAYMVGLNHEFARELLWREYPTDQRGSYFRQFWDVRKKLAAAPNPAAAREQLKDIKPLHQWPADSDLGDHDNREAGPEPEEELVLVIRGELLKKYPNTVLSAQPAKWQLGSDGRPDKSKERVLDESVMPITPLYEARVAPDLFFFGFDLTAVEARGDDAVDDKPGWFFRIEEVPGDARFGFDIDREPGSQINTWNDLAWADVVPALEDGKPVRVADIPPRAVVEPGGTEVEKHDQWDQDRHVPLSPADLSSAELAYVSLQVPVIMAIHAGELLPRQGGGHG